MVDVESYANGEEEFTEFSCGECGHYHSDQHEAEECCNSSTSTKLTPEEQNKISLELEELYGEERLNREAEEVEKYLESRKH